MIVQLLAFICLLSDDVTPLCLPFSAAVIVSPVPCSPLTKQDPN